MLYAFANPFNCVYSAAKLKENPLYPARNVMGTGPFRFVEHVAGSHWKGERFKDYFKPGLPYLDGFRAVFTQGPALINALQGGQIMADFRSVTDRRPRPAGRRARQQDHRAGEPLAELAADHLQHARRSRSTTPRVRRALSLAIDRWKAAEVLPRSTIMRYVGGYLRPGFEFAAREEDLVKMPGFSRTSRPRAPRRGGCSRRPACRTSSSGSPTAPSPTCSPAAGVYVIDQWRQIGVETEHFQANDVLYNNSLNEGTFDVALSFQGDSVDEPTYQLARYLSVDLSSNQGKYTDRELDRLFELQKDAHRRRRRATPLLRQFETRMLTEAYNVPLLWWQRIVVMSAKVKGWQMSPSHLIGQDLETGLARALSLAATSKV